MMIRKVKQLLPALLGGFLFLSCVSPQEKFIRKNAAFASAQFNVLLENTGEPNGKNCPRTTNKEGKLSTTGIYDWTSGFFPGSLWYLYELTNDNHWKEQAEAWTFNQEPAKKYVGNHDIGFMMYCSYGNANRIAPGEGYQEILIESANSLMSRYADSLGVIKSWNGGSNWARDTRWHYPVIIDNMMNLELLFYATRVTGDRKYYNAAVSHADKTLKNHIREDFTTYHVVDYDTLTGEPLHFHTHQGYSDNSTWSRGQAWGIYGFTMMYRETQDQKYLDAATRLADAYISRLPEDLVPLWDFNLDQEGYNPQGKSYAITFREPKRDASAAAVTCSALFELGQYITDKNYIDLATRMLHSLASENYRAKPGENAGFLIMHCVGSIPHKVEVDVPLVYADYYFLEAMNRYRNLNQPK